MDGTGENTSAQHDGSSPTRSDGSPCLYTAPQGKTQDTKNKNNKKKRHGSSTLANIPVTHPTRRRCNNEVSQKGGGREAQNPAKALMALLATPRLQQAIGRFIAFFPQRRRYRSSLPNPKLTGSGQSSGGGTERSSQLRQSCFSVPRTSRARDVDPDAV